MVLEYSELAHMKIEGTIIDFESIGEFDNNFNSWDIEFYADHKPTIFGYLTNGSLKQYCAEGKEEIGDILRIIKEKLRVLKKPFYAFNCHFEKGIIHNQCKITPPLFIDVRRDVYRGRKWDIRGNLGIPKYNDPFDGNSSLCVSEWSKGNYEDCLKHNRACLLIERDIQEYSWGLRSIR